MVPRHAGPDAAVAVGVQGTVAVSGVNPGHVSRADGFSVTTSEYDRTASRDADAGIAQDNDASIWHDGASRLSSIDSDTLAHKIDGYAARAAATLRPLTIIDGAMPMMYPALAAAAADDDSCVAFDGSHRHGAAPHGHSDSTAVTMLPGADATVAADAELTLSAEVGGTADDE